MNGFFVVLENFRTENMEFIPGEVAALFWVSCSHVLIVKTGKTFGGYSNKLDLKYLANLRKLSPKEISEISDKPIDPVELDSSFLLGKACRRISGSLPVY